ncbi:MAG: hypothetical protein JWM95_542 [Gemmatimonadetes bacterium]|nr:hypothetical protein [Gemmatimonadota bacterium]
MSDHSLTTIVTDSFTAPRWVHHLVKLATGALVLILLALLERYELGASTRLAWPVAGALSVAWFLSLRVAYWLDHHGKFITPDLWCDLALHAAPITIAVALTADRVLGGVAFALCLTSYMFTYPDASP